MGRNTAGRGGRAVLTIVVASMLGPAAYCVAAFGQGSVFRWTDSDGTIHFSDSNVPRDYAGITEEKKRPRVRMTTGQPSVVSTSIPLVAQDGRKFVSAMLEGPLHSRQVMMLVDTGAQMSMIDEELADALGVEFVSDAGIVGVTGTAPGWVGRIQRLKLDNRELSDWPILVGPTSGIALLGADVLDQLELSVGSTTLEGR